MDDSEIAGILLAAVIVLALIITVLYIIISYRLWKRSPEAERRNFCLNRIFRHNMESRERKKVDKQNKRNLDIEVNGSGSVEGCDNKVFTTAGYSNVQDDVVLNPASVTLEVPRSPIRKSAGTYSVVDLNDDG
ncbi:uncharacterized protein LOC123560325 [Mercenaria mercenaria]|uniref:uncharacterized protein LOC123560325 n=1 Tax=Mercenaria mercenaria TaxID=6596 RepID=UPI001E1D541D|nr:uncharacterized protein LOC123560325 [Mercenaria mercenaria]